MSSMQSVSARVRLVVMGVVAVCAAVATGLLGSWSAAPLVGWDAAAAVFAGSVWLGLVLPLSASGTAAHATRDDPSRTESDLIVLIAAVASLAAVALIIGEAESAKGVHQDLLAAFALVSVALSWFAVHTLFTLRYARLYYSGAVGGIDFNQSTPPKYLDFAYLSFTIGMTFQVSDTNIESPVVRATALRHGLLAFLLGAVILASTINLIAGLGRG